MLDMTKIIGLPKGGIYKVYFRYTTKLEGYANLSSDIPELSEIMFRQLLILFKHQRLIMI